MGSMPGIDELCAAISSCGLKFAQVEWDPSDKGSPPPLPYVLVVPGSGMDTHAGDTILARYTSYDAELYTRGRDPALEQKLEDAFISVGLIPDISHVPLGDGVLETVYTMAVAGR